MKNFFLTLVFSWLFFNSLSAQIINGTDTLYGNEWIKFDQSYFKIMVAEDGIYRVGYQELTEAGLPVATIDGSKYQLFHNGKEVPIYTSTPNPFSPTDYLEFYGQKNRSELDQHLFQNPEEEMMNPLYSLFTDTSAYFLTWTDIGIPLRFEELGNDLTNLPPKENYYLEEQVMEYHSSWDKEKNGQGVSVSNFTMAEGYSSNYANIQSFNLVPTFPYVNGPGSKLHIRYAGNLKQHSQQISINGQDLSTDNYYGFEVRKLNFDIDNALLYGNMELKFQGLTDNNDRQRISNIILTYPRAFNFNNSTSYLFNIKNAGINKYLEIENFNAGNSAILFDLTNNKRQIALPENGLVKINLLPSQNDRTLLLINSDVGAKKVSAITPIEFIDYGEIDANFIFLSNPKLYDDGNGNNYVQEYADYRSSQIGGGYKTVIVDIQQVYDQFGWGINRHSLSVRNFAHFVKKEWDEVQYFFVVGKGREYTAVRTGTQLGSANNVSFYVPTFGVPGADNLLLSTNETATPLIPLGRIPVATAEDIEVYMQKVKDFESNKNLSQSIEERDWMKNILHLGGGGNVGEQSIIRSYLQSMGNKIETGKFAGNVSGFYKNSTDPIQQAQSDEIFNIINEGTSMITIFGHSSVGAFDFSIDNPANYENYKKYPMLFSLGCYSGNVHTAQRGVGEGFIFFKDRGTIGFAASTGQAYISSLNTFMNTFYDLIGGDMYGESISKVLQATIQTYDNGIGLNGTERQFTYSGDPSIRLNYFPGPDFVVDRGSVSFSPAVINVQQGKFEMGFEILNIGKNTFDSLQVEVEMELPSGQKKVVVHEKIRPEGHSTSISYNIPITGKEYAGLNKFYIKVDVANDIAELPVPAAELNNELASPVTLFILDNSAYPVYPQDFAIMGEQGVVLKASTTDALAPLRKYLMEIDTTAEFNSTWKKTTEITQTGGVIKWKPAVQYIDSTVYYWRISPELGAGIPDYVWETSSFIYLEGSSPGWNQSHYFQFLGNEFDQMEFQTNRTLKFTDASFNIRIINKIFDPLDPPAYIYDFANPAASVKPWNVNSKHIAVVVGDSITGAGWVNSGNLYGSINGGSSRVFVYPTSSATERQVLMNFLDNIIPENNFVFLFTTLGNANANLSIQDWEQDSSLFGKNLFQILEAEGAEQFNLLKEFGSVPYTICYKKSKGVLVEGIAEKVTDVLDLNVFIPIQRTEGSLKSTIIGPARSWESLSWRLNDLESDNDTVYLSVTGIDKQLQETLLIEKYQGNDTSLTSIDANLYPYLKIEYFGKDLAHRTPGQLDYWRVNYQGLPEAAVNPSAYFYLYNDTLQQGEPLQFSMNIENIGNYDMDSMLVKFTLIDENNTEEYSFARNAPLSKNDSLNVNFSSETFSKNGLNRLIVEINPNEDQPELVHLNNFASSQFYVQSDRRNPLLDVTFDGRHLIDGDIVSSKPKVIITLNDENEFLLLSDTSILRIFLAKPGESELQELIFGGSDMVFTPASSATENKAVIEFNPVLTEDGVYKLLIQARDMTGNQSGEYAYSVTFEVVTRDMISNVFNYPNPFSTSTRFYYTLTGSEPPAFFKIQIMTVSGRIVKEITQDQLGPLQIGSHLTDYVWDGTDEFGDKLANGVYLYKVIAKNAVGKEFDDYDEYRQTNTDQYFKNNIGKLVILR